MEAREKSDFLKYCDDNGLFADFHSNRHLFITSLERAKPSPKMAQTLARHSDVRLTLGIYTHVGLHDQTAAIQSLPAPPARHRPAERRGRAPLNGYGRAGRPTHSEWKRAGRGAHHGAEGCRKWCHCACIKEAANRIKLHR